eukprot:CAMPEP_0180809600 /NCGR_PEP_ID=MMETSP1038_2-20121128/64410_1 /TAXON_ID=632150 /ORGANISM="Azadinium spinosum, Strain 3D9" /LENGTH=68 /DNA_ID=CAMNT_0022850779 /DNA_START=66 /DNA_END=268 /DNA_ORIENTATION=+
MAPLDEHAKHRSLPTLPVHPGTVPGDAVHLQDAVPGTQCFSGVCFVPGSHKARRNLPNEKGDLVAVAG